LGHQIEGRLIAIDPVGDIGSEFQGLWRLERVRKLYIRTREITKSETEKEKKVPIEASLLLNVLGFGISTVVKTRGRDSLFLELPKSRNAIQLCRRTWPSISGKSTFRVSEGGKVENLDNRIREIVKPEIPKKRKGKSR
jgi:hypothetical protein